MFIIIIIIVIIILFISDYNKDNFENLDNKKKKNILCRKPTINNPFANPLFNDYNDNINIKACNAEKTILLRKKIFNNNINAKKNKLFQSKIKLNNYYFYQLPNTYNIPDTIKFGKKIFLNNNKSGECKRFNKNCHFA